LPRFGLEPRHPNLKLGENEMVQFHRVSEAGSVASLLG